jgi:hypothetical protein
MRLFARGCLQVCGIGSDPGVERFLFWLQPDQDLSTMSNMTVKEQLHKLVEELPDEDPVEEMQYRLYVMRKVEKGLKSIDEGRGIEHAEVVERMKRWVQE